MLYNYKRIVPRQCKHIMPWQVPANDALAECTLGRTPKRAQDASDGTRQAILVDRLRERNRQCLPSGVWIVRYQARQALPDGLFRRRAGRGTLHNRGQRFEESQSGFDQRTRVLSEALRLRRGPGCDGVRQAFCRRAVPRAIPARKLSDVNRASSF